MQSSMFKQGRAKQPYTGLEQKYGNRCHFAYIHQIRVKYAQR